ncbi:ABC transporter ATP-binding protein [Microbacterium profundi]|uniref:ABC transporter ATP-binding protein n=1 Tax=Microbacterium profundi TaxID=450380 RepID=UPI001F27E180|nr:ABC transporter ATP-binding protein [Microbacterium profundi]MCE7481188.1 ABC transporter ATP-binding protein [Microbacterium profundi]
MTTPVLQLDSIRAFYGGALILDGVHLEVAEGECVALLGPNGVGKTTSLNSIFGIARVRAGAVRIDGVELSRKRAHEAARLGAALVPQGRWIVSSLSVEENLLLGQASGRDGAWDLGAVYEMFPVLKERAAARGDALSGGQQQMLAIGRALMSNPRVLLLDEPSEGLAPVVVDALGDALAQLRAQGTSMLLIEQRLDLVMRLAERYAVMAKGRIVSEGRIEETSLDELKNAVSV